MISPYFPSEETPSPPRTLASQVPGIPSPPLPPHSPNLAFPPSPSSLQAPIPPPPPLPLPAPATGTAPPHVFGLEKSHLLKEALEKAGPAPRSREDVKRLLKLHKDRFRSDLQWILFCADLPSLIQEGPQCGLVALWMAGTLLAPPSGIPLERLMQMAVERGYSAQGEMFSGPSPHPVDKRVTSRLEPGCLGSQPSSATSSCVTLDKQLTLCATFSAFAERVVDMGRLAQEALGCQAELLCGGLGGPNRDRVLQHLVAGHPLLIPYDEDFNHEPCQKKGHKAHWAVSTGVLLGVQGVPSPGYAEDPELPGLFHPMPGTPCQPPSLPDEGSPEAVYLLSKQGKSWHYQLWDYNQIRDSNLQLTDFSPSRAADGREYVVPAGGVRAGLCGQALLLRPQDSSH